METKYETLKRALRKASKAWDDRPLSNSAKNAYYAARADMAAYYKEVTTLFSAYICEDKDSPTSV